MRAVKIHLMSQVFLLGLILSLSSCGGNNTKTEASVSAVNAQVSGSTNLTNSSKSEQAPRWSPDGKKIAFSVNNTEIYVMNADGSGQTNLTKNPAIDQGNRI